MPVELVLGIVDGWKQIDNNRFGQCLEVRFVNTVNGEVLFRYAPLLKDKDFFNELFSVLDDYDCLHKQIFSLVKTRIEGTSHLSLGECKKI